MAIIIGTLGDDILDGTTGDDELVGLSGNDSLSGFEGNDLLRGADGLDTLTGGAGNDTLRGGNGDNVFDGGDGNDFFLGGDNLDCVTYASASGPVSVELYRTDRQPTGGAGKDTLRDIEWVIGSNFNDTLASTGANDILQGGDGDDSIWCIYGDASIEGGAGNDSIVGSGTINGGDGNDTIQCPSFVFGTVDGGAGNDDLRTGQGGNYTVFGGAGDDTFGFGGLATGNLIGGDGNDTLYFNFNGTCSFDGSDGIDTVVLFQAYTTTIDLSKHGPQNIGSTFTNVENVIGRGVLIGNDGDNVLTGSYFRDTLSGKSGNDILVGGNDLDRLNGGLGSDTMTGGAGGERFIYKDINASGTTDETRDVITDFSEVASGRNRDKIDLRTLGTLAFVGSDDFTAAGQVRAFQDGSDTIVEVNAIGASDAEMSIRLATFTASNLDVFDFLL